MSNNIKLGEQKKIIWFVDEMEDERKTYKRALSKIFPEFDVFSIEPYRDTSEYNTLLVKNPNTVAFILDQRLKNYGMANYLGIELAGYLRQTNEKLPIYILTGISLNDDENNEFGAQEDAVEDIIKKEDLRDPKGHKSKILRKRLLRRINIFEEVKQDQERKFNELLTKNLKGKLSKEELQEFEKLQLNRSANIVVSELNLLKKLEEASDVYRQYIDKLPK